jgi:hypothetical protein
LIAWLYFSAMGQVAALHARVDTTFNGSDGTVEGGGDFFIAFEGTSHLSKKNIFLRRPTDPALVFLWDSDLCAEPCCAHSVLFPMDRAVRLADAVHRRGGLAAFDALARGASGSDQRSYSAIGGLAMLLPMTPTHSA